MLASLPNVVLQGYGGVFTEQETIKLWVILKIEKLKKSQVRVTQRHSRDTCDLVHRLPDRPIYYSKNNLASPMISVYN
jgi:hypothetical protein